MYIDPQRPSPDATPAPGPLLRTFMLDAETFDCLSYLRDETHRRTGEDLTYDDLLASLIVNASWALADLTRVGLREGGQ